MLRDSLGPVSLALLLLGAGAAGAQNPPIADAGDDFGVECAGPDGTEVQLDGSGSSDPDGELLAYSWTSPGFPPGTEYSGPNPSVVLPLGEHLITLTVDDGVDAVATDEVVVTIADSTPPEVEVGGEPVRLWPPNHKYHRIELSRFVTSIQDGCQGEVGARFGRVWSDEEENGTGDGNTTDDILVRDECTELKLRAERKGNGNGRVYRAEIVVEDASGNPTSAIVDVAYVPKSSRKDAVDSGEEYSVESDCQPRDPGLCPVVPENDCDGTLNGRTLLRLRDHLQRDDRDSLFFRMSNVDTSLADFGDPTVDTEYQLCVYGQETGEDETYGLILNPRASAGAAWQATSGGFAYVSPRDTDDGLTRVVLQHADGARGKILVSGSGDDLDMADLPLDEAAGVEVQLRNSLGHCWSASFPEAQRNTPTVYQASGR